MTNHKIYQMSHSLANQVPPLISVAHDCSANLRWKIASKWHEDRLTPSWFLHLYPPCPALFFSTVFFDLIVFDIFSFSLFSAILFVI